MRIRLKKGKQKELVLKAKGNLTWSELSNLICSNRNYLCHDVKNEKVTLSHETYNQLCFLAEKKYSPQIIKKLNNNWGKSKGGKNSMGSTIKLKSPEYSSELAEFIGAVLGDGNIFYYKNGKKIGVYQIRISGHYAQDKEYHLNYLKPLACKLFKLKASIRLTPSCNGRILYFSSKELVDFFVNMGLKPGSKIKNKTTIPNWIIKNKAFSRACLRGLIDTDGSIFKMSNKDPHLLRISFTNYNTALLKDARETFMRLGFHPSKPIDNKRFYLSRQSEIKKYLKEIGFSNIKHIKRLERFKAL